MLLDDVPETHGAISASLREAAGESPIWDPEGVEGIDPFVQVLVAHTSGHLYDPLVGNLSEYPIPEIRLKPGLGQTLLDIGCNWGRWSIAAARAGYRVTGIDPSLGAVLAARRVAQNLGSDIAFVVGDARFMPFRSASFETVFSYSVIQHFSKSDAITTLRQIARIIAHGGTSMIQMPNAYGVRSFFHLLKRRFSEGSAFDVRYWRPKELLQTFTELVGPSTLSVDGFGGLGIQPSDRRFFTRWRRTLVDLSEAGRRVSHIAPAIVNIADSIYVTSKKPYHAAGTRLTSIR